MRPSEGRVASSILAGRAKLSTMPAMSWHGQLNLHYHAESGRTLAHDRHHGPLRVLKPLYAEGPAICQHVLVHPPGGLAGGDTLAIDVTVDAGAHAQLTTAGATRFYRTSGAAAAQSARIGVHAGARLEWLPLETIAYCGCVAESRMQLELAAGAEAIGWEVLALGLPASDAPFQRGRFLQHIELPGRWLERGLIDAGDTRLLDSPVGLAGHRVVALLWLAAGSPLERARREALLGAARDAADRSPLSGRCGVTSPEDGVVVLRALADRVEPAMALLVAAWSAWRREAWSLAATAPRVWRT